MFFLALIIFLIFFFILSWRRPDWAVMFIVAALPAYLIRFKIFNIPFTLLEAMILIAFFCWLILQTNFNNFLRGEYKIKDFIKNSPWNKKGSVEGRKKYPFGVEIILLLIISFIAAGTAGFSAGALGIWKAYFFEPTLLYVLILNVFSPPFEGGGRGGFLGINKIGLSLAVGAGAVAIYAVCQKITGFGIANPLWAAAETRRVVSFFGYPNAVGLYLAPIIPVLAAFLFSPRQNDCDLLPEKLCYPLKKENISVIGLSRGFLAFIILLSLAAIFFAHSEGAMVGLTVAFIVGGLLGNKKTRLAVLAFLIAAVVVLSFSPNGWKTVEQKLTLHDFSGQVRRYQWKETLVMLNHGHFYQGAGLDNYQQAIAFYHQPGFFYDDGTDPLFHQHTVESAEYRTKTWRPVEIYMYPHNIFLNFWSELGLAGVLLFVWIIIKFLIFNFLFSIKEEKYKMLHLGLLCAMIVIVVHGLVDVPYFKNDLACLFWILIALSVLLRLKLTTGEKSIK
jgi:hypothetical protein